MSNTTGAHDRYGSAPLREWSKGAAPRPLSSIDPIASYLSASAPSTRPPKFEGPDRYCPLQARLTAISISTLISGV